MMRRRTLACVLPLFLVIANVTVAFAQSPAPLPGARPFAQFQTSPPTGIRPAPSTANVAKIAKAVNDASDRCTTIDFEGLGDSRFLPNFDDISLPGWISSIPMALGGGGNFANEPSPITTAFWVEGVNGNATTRDVIFGSPVSSVGLFYSSAVGVQLDAFDVNGTLITSVFGGANYDHVTNVYDNWAALSVGTAGDKIAKVTFHGSAQFTGIDDLKFCRHPTINAVEVTQAIQEYQKLADLETMLGTGGSPPVPIIAGKPGVLRIYFDELQVSTPVIVDANINGSDNSRLHLVPPSCSPDKQRRRSTGCASADFYFTPPAGAWTVTIILSDSDGNQLDTRLLPFQSRAPDFIALRAVTVCDGLDGAGNWECEDSSVFPGLTDFLRRTAPTSSVSAVVTNSVVRVDRADFPGADDWWTLMAAKVNALYGLTDQAIATLGTQRYYFGVVSNRAPGGIGGIAHDIPSHGGGGRASAIRLGVETNTEVIAHETGHLMGRQHTNTDVPQAAGSPPGCYNFAQDSSTDWPYTDNQIQSDNGLEVGFDVASDKPLQPETTFEVMSYCTPRWISPQTYVHELIDAVHGTPAPHADLKAQAVAGTFWTVSGLVSGGTASLDPIFVRDAQGSAAAGTGSYSIVVKDAGGGILFTRNFTPLHPQTETQGPEAQLKAMFFELIPVQAGAARIVVLDPGSVEIASVVLGGAAPVVAFTAPVAGAILQGQRNVNWTIDDPDSSTFQSALEYSPDGGATWIALGDTSGSTLRVDFDRLPGSNGNARLRIFVSDGVNTGSAESAVFAVPSHAPSVAIIDNGRSYFRAGDLVWLRANAYDRDDGVLDGDALQWTSSRDGPLGHGASLPVYTLTAGTHTITAVATDSDGNTASASEEITVAGAGPSVVLTPHGLITGPRSCVEVTVDAAPGSADVPLAAVRVSLDGGATFVDLAGAPLPFTFVVPGSGFFHIVAHVFDAAGLWDVKDVRFFTASPCNASNVPPVANAGPDRTIPSPGGPASVLLDGSGSTDPDSTFPSNDDIVAFDWFEDYGQPTQTSLGSGQQLQVMLGVGVHHVALRVTDHGSLTDVAQVTIKVQAGPISSNTTLDASGNPSVIGQSVTFTATVTGSNPTGAVTFNEGAAVLCNAVALTGGQAQCVTSGLGIGSHGVTAQYTGDAANDPSTSTTLTQVMNKAGTSVTISAHTPNPSMSGALVAVSTNVAVTAPGAGTPTGTITVTDGAVACPITLPATGCNLTLAGDGLKTLSATYSGDSSFTGSTSPLVAHAVSESGPLDVDSSITATKYDALTDGLIILRYLFGMTGTALTDGALGPAATRTDPAEIAAYLESIRGSLDIDANGNTDAATDGLLLIRYLFGLRGAALISGAIGAGATRTTAPDIETYIQSLMP